MKHYTASAITIALLLCLPVSAAQKKTAHPVDLIGPDLSSASSGNVAVRVGIKVDPGKPVPSSVYASFGGSPGVRLNRVGDTDEWGGEIDTTLVCNGAPKLELIMEAHRHLSPMRHSRDASKFAWFLTHDAGPMPGL